MPRIIKDLPPIPAERALKIIGGRWKVVILYYLFRGPKRLSELRRLAPKASQKVLVQQLREMESHGIVHRKIFAEVPPRVEYSITKLGTSLEPIIGSLCDWGQRHEIELNAIERGEPPAAPAPPAPQRARARRRTGTAAGTAVGAAR